MFEINDNLLENTDGVVTLSNTWSSYLLPKFDWFIIDWHQTNKYYTDFIKTSPWNRTFLHAKGFFHQGKNQNQTTNIRHL